jgi:hypothetical protein
MEITHERFAELIVAEHKYQRLCKVIQQRSSGQGLGWKELDLIVELFCPIEKEEATECK